MSRADSLVLLASAGTGKTFRLTNRLLQLYAGDVRLESVLASTFTRKAAGEILQRLIRRLCAAAGSDEECAKLAGHIGIDLDRADASELCVRLLRHIDRLRISTLDAWFKESVQQSSLDFGLPTDWEVSDPQMERQLCGRALSRALDRPRNELEWSTLISDLKRGGAESRVHAGLQSGLSHAGRFARDCTPDAWDFPPQLPDVEQRDFESALETLERSEVPLTQAGKPRKNYSAALPRTVEAVRDKNWQAFVAETLVQRVVDGSLKFDSCAIPADAVAALRVLLGRAAHQLARQLRAQNGALRVLVADFLEELDAATLQERRLSFDALPRLLVLHAAERNASDAPDHLLLDEFQDTSSLQWRALEANVNATLERDDASFFCVGDVKQSIYAWRDGNPLLLAELPGLLGLPVEQLAESYRSSQKVLDFVNLIFESIDENTALEGLEARAAALRFKSGFEPHRAHKQLEGSLRIWCCAKTEERQLVKPREDARLARGVAAALELHAAHPEWSLAFLVRSKKLVPQLIERLKRAGLQASGEGGNPLTDSGAVNAALSMLEFADHPADEFLAFLLATSPFAGHAGIAYPSSEAQRHAASLALRKRWLALGPAEFLGPLEGTVREHYGPFDQRRFAQLLSLAGRLRPSERLRPARFAERLALERVPDPASSQVRVMSVHGAKGLEFDAVILIDLDGKLIRAENSVVAHRRDGDPRAVYDVVTHPLNKEAVALLPDLQEVQRAAKTVRLHEELCVLYVALTRAVHHLELAIDFPGEDLAKSSFAGIILQGMGVREVKPSSWVGEDGGEPILGRSKISAEPGRRAAASDSAAQARRIELLGGEAPIGYVTPSRAARAEAGNEPRPTRELFKQADSARRRGVLWHAWFEGIAWSEDGLPCVAQLIDRAREAGLGQIETREAHELLAALAAPEIRAQLSRAEAAVRLGAHPEEIRLLREGRFAYLRDAQGGSELVQGAFDRAVISDAEKRAEIIDFKTDAIDSGDERSLRERAEKYRPQMELYRSALARLAGLDETRIAMRVCFVVAGRSVELA